MSYFYVFHRSKKIATVYALDKEDACLQIHREYGVPLKEMSACEMINEKD